MDIIDEAITYFRVNVLFKNFEIRGPGDKVLVYLFVLISHFFKTVEQMYTIYFISEKMSQLLRKDYCKLLHCQYRHQNKKEILWQLCFKMEIQAKENFIINTLNN
jgi:hypothetical protein